MTDSIPTSTEHEIDFLSGKYRLKGTLHLPDTPLPPVVFGSHGLLSDSESPKQKEVARQCNNAGIAFFRFDHRGRGRSEGGYKEVASLEGRCEDLASAVKTIRQRHDIGEKMGLFGSSMGGAVSIASAEKLKPDTLVIYAAPIRSRKIKEVVEKEPENHQAGRPLYDPEKFKFDLSSRLPLLHHVLVIHGDNDTVVPISNGHLLHDLAKQPKKLVILKNGDHLLSDVQNQKQFIRETISWFKKYLFD